MKKWLLIVESNCTDPDRDADFNEWYNNIHLPDMLELPAVVRVDRYENINPGDGEAKYIALYEIESDDIHKTIDDTAKHIQSKASQGRMSDLLQATRRIRAQHIFSMQK
ncbi:MAG: hypothetical protein PVH87_05315 [Desulfobacteraceae bacterium]